MRPRFQVTVEAFDETQSIPGGLTQVDYRALLEKLDFDGIEEIGEDELGQYAAMALQDLEPEEGAALVLSHVLSGRLRPGQIQNLCEEMKDERQWEEYPDLHCHEPIFNAQVLLHEAFPADYPAPDVVRVSVRIEAVSAEGKSLLRKRVSEPLLVRMLADGMPGTAILRRFFDDQLAKRPFPEASQILWTYSVEARDAEGQAAAHSVATIYSPRYWMGPLDDVESFSSAAFADDE